MSVAGRFARPPLVSIFVLAPLLVCGFVACGSGGSGTDGVGELPGDDGGTGGDGALGTQGHDGGSSGDGAGNGGDGAGSGGDAADPNRIQTVFLIMMENHSWSTINGNEHATYITSLLPLGGHAEQYSTPPGNHPSELNYIWLESGSNLTLTTDDPPAKNHRPETDHLVTLLDKAGVSWKAYVEEISGNDCPLTDSGKYVARHVPMLFFDDVTGSNDANSANCKAHVRPYGELAGDLTADKVARYNFITPNLCDDMHGLTVQCGTTNFNEIGAGDAWLKAEIPKIMASNAYKNNGVIFILWDEGDESLISKASDGPIPLIVLSPKAKAGYASQTKLTHSSMLRSVQEIFGVTPLLRDAQNATDLGEFFTSFP
jgi:phosphatidylinositol-3-phosphatase